MEENIMKKGYWIYSIIAIIIGFGLFAFWGYLLYDLIIKLSEKDFSNNTVVQALFTLVSTVFVGGYFSKYIENKFAKRNELYKTRISVSLELIDLASQYYHNNTFEVKNMLIIKSAKVKLFFDDETLKKMNNFINSNKKIMLENYNILIDDLKNKIK